MGKFITILASAAYLGYIPLIPGTAGSVLGLFLGRWVAPLWINSPAPFLVLYVSVFGAACLIAGKAERLFGEADSSRIVIDEVFGMIAAMCFNPVRWGAMLSAFALFRLFDIVKPWPASYFDRMSGGAGVMLDDLTAGVYANLILQMVRHLI